MTWIGYATLAALLAGLVPIFGKVGVQGIDPAVATGVRAAIILGALLAILLTRVMGYELGLSRRAMLFLVLSGAAGAGSWACFFRALQLGDALRVAAVDRLSAAVTLAAAAFFLHERAPVWSWIGTLLMVIGAVIVAVS
jgi:bacterial/archaeal transporter family protein